jgi:DNA polymerase-3 subunit delta
MPVLILAGDEDFEISRRLAQLKIELVDPAWLTFNWQRLDNPGLHEVTEAAAGVPFGPGNRVVVIDRCALFTKKRSKSGPAETVKQTSVKAVGRGKAESEVDPAEFEKVLASVHPQTYLVFSCPYNFDSTLKLSKAAAKVAKVEAFPKEKYWPGSSNARLRSWCQKEAKRFSATIADEAIQYLLDSTEANLRQVSAEIEKAAVAIMPNTHITEAVVIELSPHHSSVFDLADRWLSGKPDQAIIALNEILNQQSGIPVLAALQTMFGRWIRLRVLVDKHNAELPSAPGVERKELPLAELTKRIAAELKLVPFIVEKDLRKLIHVSAQDLIAKRDELTRMELMLKSGAMPERHALELFVHGALTR